MNNIEKLAKKVIKENQATHKKVNLLLSKNNMHFIECIKMLTNELKTSMNLKGYCIFSEGLYHKQAEIHLWYKGVPIVKARSESIIISIYPSIDYKKLHVTIKQYDNDEAEHYFGSNITLEQFCSDKIQKKFRLFVEEGKKKLLSNTDIEKLNEKKQKLLSELKKVNNQLKEVSSDE